MRRGPCSARRDANRGQTNPELVGVPMAGFQMLLWFRRPTVGSALQWSDERLGFWAKTSWGFLAAVPAVASWSVLLAKRLS